MKNWDKTLLVFSTFVLLHLAVMPFVGYLTGSGEISLFLGVVLAIVFIFSAKHIWDRGYLNNRKVKDVFIVVSLLCVGTLFSTLRLLRQKLRLLLKLRLSMLKLLQSIIICPSIE